MALRSMRSGKDQACCGSKIRTVHSLPIFSRSALEFTNHLVKKIALSGREFSLFIIEHPANKMVCCFSIDLSPLKYTGILFREPPFQFRQRRKVSGSEFAIDLLRFLRTEMARTFDDVVDRLT